MCNESRDLLTGGGVVVWGGKIFQRGLITCEGLMILLSLSTSYMLFYLLP